MSTAETTDTCTWFPQAPTCGHGTRTTSCEYRDACSCQEGWTTDLTTAESTYEAYLRQCNTPVEVYETQQAQQVNRTINGTEPSVVPAPAGVSSGRINTVAIGAILLALVGMILLFCYWRKRRGRSPNVPAHPTDKRHFHVKLCSDFRDQVPFSVPKDEDRMPRIHPYLNPYSVGMMHPPSHSPHANLRMQDFDSRFDGYSMGSFNRNDDMLQRPVRDEYDSRWNSPTVPFRSSSNEELSLAEHYRRTQQQRQNSRTRSVHENGIPPQSRTPPFEAEQTNRDSYLPYEHEPRWHHR